MGTDIHGFLETRYRPTNGWFRSMTIDRDRNYRLFAALADVRNGYGFAGVPTHKPITPISAPRGLPEDHTTGYGEDADFEFGDHSFSWLSLEEVTTWEGWDQGLDEVGFISREQFEVWEPGTAPHNWAGGIDGPSIIHADATSHFFPEGWTHVRVRWSRSLRESCQVFLAWLEYAKVKVGDREDARIVFGFDS